MAQIQTQLLRNSTPNQRNKTPQAQNSQGKKALGTEIKDRGGQLAVVTQASTTNQSSSSSRRRTNTQQHAATLGRKLLVERGFLMGTTCWRVKAWEKRGGRWRILANYLVGGMSPRPKRAVVTVSLARANAWPTPTTRRHAVVEGEAATKPSYCHRTYMRLRTIFFFLQICSP